MLLGSEVLEENAIEVNYDFACIACQIVVSCASLTAANLANILVISV